MLGWALFCLKFFTKWRTKIANAMLILIFGILIFDRFWYLRDFDILQILIFGRFWYLTDFNIWQILIFDRIWYLAGEVAEELNTHLWVATLRRTCSATPTTSTPACTFSWWSRWKCWERKLCWSKYEYLQECLQGYEYFQKYLQGYHCPWVWPLPSLARIQQVL